MQVILDSSFACPGSAPIWGRKKGEFRDWTGFSYVGKILDDRGFYFLPTIPDFADISDIRPRLVGDFPDYL